MRQQPVGAGISRSVVGEYELLRVREGRTIRIDRGGSERDEPRETFAIIRDGHTLFTGGINDSVFCSGKYGNGMGLAATDEQIVDAVVNDEPLW